jgi:hypothetical protein
MVHLGVNQQKAITITAMQKIGTDSIEDTDESAKLYYKYGKYEDDSEWILVENEDKSTHTLTLSSVENKDIIIKALHNETEYETETITYSPLNTPVLDLSNDTDTILYSADGNELLGNSVNSKATLYLNGDNLGETETVTYV